MPYDPFTVGGFNAAMMGAGGNAYNLQGMINQTSNALEYENARRVLLSNAERNMDFRRERDQREMEMEKYRIDADAANQIRQLKASMSGRNGWTSRTLRQDPRTGEYRMMEDWE